MSLTHQDVQKILAILDQSECEELTLEYGEIKLHWRKHSDGPDSSVQNEARTQTSACELAAPTEKEAPSPLPARQPPAAAEPIPDGLAVVTAPMLGTFYRSPSPGEDPFVEPGARVAPDDTVCLVEVMKLFSSVKAGLAGTVEKILVENGSLVEYGQPLLLIRKETPPAPEAK